jgi:hypothetical protein
MGKLFDNDDGNEHHFVVVLLLLSAYLVVQPKRTSIAYLMRIGGRCESSVIGQSWAGLYQFYALGNDPPFSAARGCAVCVQNKQTNKQTNKETRMVRA